MWMDGVSPLGNADAATRRQSDLTWPRKSEAAARALTSAYWSREFSGEGDAPIRRFEREFQEWLGHPFVLALNSGAAGLFTALAAARIQAGDQVVVPAFTYHATATPALLLGAEIVLCGCDPVSGNLDPDLLDTIVTEKTKAIIFTHMWGAPCDVRRIREIADRVHALVIEDCSSAFGARVAGMAVGTFGDAAFWSCHFGKALPVGEGGLLAVSRSDLRDRAALVAGRGDPARSRAPAAERDLAETGIGLKFRMNPLAAVLGSEGLTAIDHVNEVRSRNARLLIEAMHECRVLRPPRDEPGRVFHRFVIRLDRDAPCTREQAIEVLRSEGVDARPTNIRPLCDWPIFRDSHLLDFGPPPSVVRWPPAAVAGARGLAESAIELPVFSGPEDELLAHAYARGLVAADHRMFSRS